MFNKSAKTGTCKGVWHGAEVGVASPLGVSSERSRQQVGEYTPVFFACISDTPTFYLSLFFCSCVGVLQMVDAEEEGGCDGWSSDR